MAQYVTHDLWEQWRDTKFKDPKKLDELLSETEPLIRSYVSRVGGTKPPAWMINHGKILTAKALPNYDPSKAKINTFIIHNLQPIKRKIGDLRDPIRIPESIAKHFSEARLLSEIEGELREELQREPNDAELLDELNWTKSKLKKTRKTSRRFFKSLTTGWEDGGGSDFDSLYRGTPEETLINFVYTDLSNKDKVIFEHSFQMNGKKKIGDKSLAKKLKIKEWDVRTRRQNMRNKVKGILGGVL